MKNKENLSHLKKLQVVSDPQKINAGSNPTCGICVRWARGNLNTSPPPHDH